MAFRISSPPTWVLAALGALVVVGVSAWSIAACGPWDPWETHYGEVARQILVRSDPLDLWWRPGTGPDGNAENTFWSKPALPFWLMALSMKLLGVGTAGTADEMVRAPWPELAIRLPSMLTGLACAAFLGWTCARILAAARPRDPSGPARAGIFTALALCTMPQWAIVSRQALTDMFFVAPVTLAMAAWALAWLRPDRPLRRRPLAAFLPRRLRARVLGTGPQGHAASDPSSSDLADRPLRVPDAPAPSTLSPPARVGRLAALLRQEIPWDRAYLGFLVLFLIAVVAPIVALDLHVSSDHTVARVARFARKPGVPSYDTLVKIHRVLLGYGAIALLVFLRSLRWRTRAQTWMGILYLAAGLSLVGKGMIGPGLVGLLVLLHLIVTGRLGLRTLWRCGPLTGLALFALAALPWHHAMWIYRGDSWFNELIIINNLARFGTGEQDQAVGGFAYYLRTLGLAALPWSAALPAVLWAAARRLHGRAPDNLSSAPPSPPEAPEAPVLAGDLPAGGHVLPAPGGSPLAPAGPSSPPHAGDHVPTDLSSSPSDTARGPRTDAPSPPPDHVPADLSSPSSDPAGGLWRLALLWFCATLALLTASVTKYYHYLLPALPPFALLLGLWLADPPPARDRRLAWTAAGLGAVILALVLRDVIVEPAWIAHLTTYLYEHMWRNGAPPTADLAYCALPFALGLGLLAARRRRAGLSAMLLGAFLTLHFTLNSYLPAASEHWSQRSAIRHYYEHRGPDDPLASWWFYYRGETFLTKAEVWVQKEAEREPLVELVDAHRGQGRSLWLITTIGHLNRAKSSVPNDLRRNAEVAYENAHYVLIKFPIP